MATNAQAGEILRHLGLGKDKVQAVLGLSVKQVGPPRHLPYLHPRATAPLMPREHRPRLRQPVCVYLTSHPPFQVVDQVLRNQGVQASEWGDVEGVVAHCGTRVLETVGHAHPHTHSQTPRLCPEPCDNILPSTIDAFHRFCRRCGGCGRTRRTLIRGGRWGRRCWRGCRSISVPRRAQGADIATLKDAAAPHANQIIYPFVGM